MGQTCVPETLVTHQKLTPGYNPKTFKQHYDHGGRLQLHKSTLFFTWHDVCSVESILRGSTSIASLCLIISKTARHAKYKDRVASRNTKIFRNILSPINTEPPTLKMLAETNVCLHKKWALKLSNLKES
jgi:hypothetical protein